MRFDLSRRHLGRCAGAAALAPWLASCGGGGSGDSGVLGLPVAANSREAGYVQAVESIFTTYRPPGILAGVRLAGEAAGSAPERLRTLLRQPVEPA